MASPKGGNSLIGNEDYLDALEVALSHRKEFPQPAPGCWGSVELVFAAEQVCPMPLVVRSVGKILGPIVNAIGLQEVLKAPKVYTGTGQTVLSTLVGLVLGCAYESYTAQAGFAKLGRNDETLERLRMELTDTMQQLKNEREAAQQQQKQHLQNLEQLLIQLDTSQNQLARERDHVSGLYKELDDLKDVHAVSQRSVTHLEATLARLRAMQDDELMDEVARGRILQSQKESGEEELNQLRHLTKKQDVELGCWETKFAMSHVEQFARAEVCAGFLAETMELTFCAQLNSMRKTIQTMRVQLSLLAYNPSGGTS